MRFCFSKIVFVSLRARFVLPVLTAVPTKGRRNFQFRKNIREVRVKFDSVRRNISTVHPHIPYIFLETFSSENGCFFYNIVRLLGRYTESLSFRTLEIDAK